MPHDIIAQALALLLVVALIAVPLVMLPAKGDDK